MQNIKAKIRNGNYYNILELNFKGLEICQVSFEDVQVPHTYNFHLQQTHRGKKWA